MPFPTPAFFKPVRSNVSWAQAVKDRVQRFFRLSSIEGSRYPGYPRVDISPTAIIVPTDAPSRDVAWEIRGKDAQLEEIKTFMQDQRKANKDLQSKLDAMEHTIAHLQQVNRLGILEQSALLYPEQARFLLKHLLRSASSEKAPFAKLEAMVQERIAELNTDIEQLPDDSSSEIVNVDILQSSGLTRKQLLAALEFLLPRLSPAAISQRHDRAHAIRQPEYLLVQSAVLLRSEPDVNKTPSGYCLRFIAAACLADGVDPDSIASALRATPEI